MPTISQLPPASSVSASDALPISQAGAARAATIGTLLASTQPAIIVESPSLIGRTSLGQGGPEQVDVGIGMTLSGGTIVADGSDHANFPSVTSLSIASDLVISNQGTPMLMQASLLRGMYSAGQNVTITSNGVISTSVAASTGNSTSFGTAIGNLGAITSLSAQDLVAVSHAGVDSAITYGNLLAGVTIDQAQHAGPVTDIDTFWAAQGSNVMVSQNFSSVWVWVASRLPTYKAPIVEITASTNLDATVHNGRTLVCSHPVALTPLTANMGNGFQCYVINASSGIVTLGNGFVSSTGGLTLAPWQSASLYCFAYSGGTIAFAAMPSVGVVSVPGQVAGLSSSAVTAATITISWQPPSSGGAVASYLVQYRPTGSASWVGNLPVTGAPVCQITGLQAATSYDVVVAAINASGSGAASAILTTATSGSVLLAAPSQVSGLAALPTSSQSIGLTWAAQSGANAATSFTVQYRITGASVWLSIPNILGASNTVSGLQAATSYEFAVSGVNASGSGPVSSAVTATTFAASQSASSISWNLVPSGTFAHASGSIGVNARVSPASSPIQFGFSLSGSIPPSSWTAAIPVNTDLWGAYVPTPPTPGTWYTWAEGLDGSAVTVNSSPFLVQ